MKWIFAVAAIMLFSGCVNRPLVDLYNGTYCSSANVQQYAEAHGISYEEALTQLRSEANVLWEEEGTRKNQLTSKPLSPSNDSKPTSAAVTP